LAQLSPLRQFAQAGSGVLGEMPPDGDIGAWTRGRTIQGTVVNARTIRLLLAFFTSTVTTMIFSGSDRHPRQLLPLALLALQRSLDCGSKCRELRLPSRYQYGLQRLDTDTDSLPHINKNICVSLVNV